MWDRSVLGADSPPKNSSFSCVFDLARITLSTDFHGEKLQEANGAPGVRSQLYEGVIM